MIDIVNLYYDKLIDKSIPVPNGTLSYNFKKKLKVAFVSDRDRNYALNKTTEFFNTMKAVGVEINLYTGKRQVPNLFYPIEFTGNLKHNILIDIPEKSIARIRKGKMKMLFLIQQLSPDYVYMESIKNKLEEELKTYNIPKHNVYVITSELSGAWKKFFGDIKIFGIDWWQISHQLTAKSRYHGEDFYWVNMHSKNKLVNHETENFNVHTWNSPPALFNSLTGFLNIHNIAFVSDVIANNLDQYGLVSYNIFNERTNYQVDKNNINLIYKYWTPEYKQKKYKAIDKVIESKNVIDYDYNKFGKDTLRFDKTIFENTLFTVTSEKFCSSTQSNYPEEATALYLTEAVWKMIAIGHPFMVIGSMGVWNYLNNQGYFGYHDLFDQKYDRVSTLYRKIELICDNIRKLSTLSLDNINGKIEDVKPFLIHNKGTFYMARHSSKFYNLFKEMKYE